MSNNRFKDDKIHELLGLEPLDYVRTGLQRNRCTFSLARVFTWGLLNADDYYSGEKYRIVEEES